jgi:hypothetical protein
MPTLNLQVSASSDDAFKEGVNYQPTGVLSAGNVNGNNATSAARFTGVGLAQGTTLTSAILTLKAQASYTGPTTLKVNVYCEDVDDSAALSSNIDTRTLTTAFTNWDIHAVTAETDYTVDITSAVQEVINRAGWASGNDLTVLIKNDTSPLSEWQDFHSYDTGTTKAAKLVITYGSGAVARPQLMMMGVG